MSRGGATPYRKGAAFERKVQKDLQDRGYFVVRSPASHSEIDLLAVTWLDNGLHHVQFVQCKMRKNGMSVRERVELYRLANTYGADAVLAYQDDGEIVYTTINRRGEIH